MRLHLLESFCTCLMLETTASAATLDRFEDLTQHVRSNVVARTNASSTKVFTSINDGTGFVRSSRFWLNGLSSLTAIHAGHGPGATAITPWHVVGANHWKNDAGSKLYFCDLQNHTVTRTVVAGTEIRPDIKSDIWLAVLDEALPASIAPMPLMPPDWTNHVLLSRFPVAALNKNNEFGSAEIYSFHQPVNGWFTYGYLCQHSSLAPKLQFVALQAGDSGRPIVTFANGDLVLLSHLTFEPGDGKFAGPDYSLYGVDIQAAIKTLGSNSTAKGQVIGIMSLKEFR